MDLLQEVEPFQAPEGSIRSGQEYTHETTLGSKAPPGFHSTAWQKPPILGQKEVRAESVSLTDDVSLGDFRYIT